MQSCSRITVLGDGQMGLVCAAVLAQNDQLAAPVSVRLWGHEPDEVRPLARTRKSPRLAGFRLPDQVVATADDPAALRETELVVAAVPTQFLRGVLERVAAHVPPGTGVVSVAKGIENGTLRRPTEIIGEVLGRAGGAGPRGVLSGPTIAPELARCLPATMIAASDDEAFAGELQRLFTTSWLRIYTGSDVVGVELAGAIKNVIAIAAGILDGLHAGYNAKSALLARGLAEIARLGAAAGARSETFFGLAGVGDLATTCFSPEGRNRSLGEALGRGERLHDYLARTDSVVEGVDTTRAVMELAGRLGVEMPIVAAVHAVLYEGLDPIDGIARLMSRRPKAERVG
ncbi:MAG: NAD(P)-dependent glycerol-3-phosphate dehydrogenase [Phycisphaerales bacterium]|nr:NAD(P)-dependent glycerol-3-phosphate dehydrogenase [Phycisphaerales bacterium]